MMSKPGLPLGFPGASALVVGTMGHIEGSILPEIPAVAATVRAVGQELVARCGLDPAQVRTVVDPRDPVAFGEEVTIAAESAKTVLIVYYIGHGLVGVDGQLYLATHITDDLIRGLAFKAFAYSALRSVLAASMARSIVLVLDCCFSGRAKPIAGAGTLFETSYPSGGFVLASAAPEELALAPPNAPYTAFSGQLLRLLRQGDPAGPPHLTLDYAYRYLSRTLRGSGFPQPHCQSHDRAGELVLAVNPAYQPPERLPQPAEPDGGQAPELDICPYRGLASFGSDDARYFFGRKRLTAELVSRVSAQLSADGPVVVVGPSGAGKSSVLRAGLLPALDRGLPAAPEAWRWPRLVLTPGEHPVTQLAAVLGSVLHRAPEDIRAALIEEPESIVECLDAGPARDGSRLVLVVDQFEELFTACSDEREREVFIQALSAACTHTAEAPAARAVVLLGLRADFYGHCGAHPVLVDALRQGQVLVGPMTGGELRDAIEKPARLAGLTVEPGLVDLLLQDLRVGESAPHGAGAALPLLSHALLATWQKRVSRTLTMAGYRAAGGIWGAVARTAEDTYLALDPAGQRAARLVLLRMVRLGESAEDTRRRVALTELDPAAEPAVPAAVDALAQARLITLDNDSAEITHEAVLRAWPRLTTWIETDRAGLLVRQRLHEAADAWQRDDHDPGALYRGVRLAAARQWIEDSGQQHGITPVAQTFLDASTAQQDAEQHAARRRTTRLRALAATLAVLLVAAIAGVGVAVWQSRRAAEQRDLAAEQRDLLASKVAAQAADRLRATDPTLALHLALAARRVADTLEARSSLYNSTLAPFYTPLTGHADAVTRLVYNSDRHLLASSGKDRAVRLWDFTDRRHPRTAAVIRRDTDKAGLALSRDGQLLAARDTDTSMRLWNLADLATPVAVATLPDTPGAVTFSPNGRVLATVGEKTSFLWDLTDPRHPRRAGTLPAGTGLAQSGSFSSDGHTLAIVRPAADNADNLVAELWDVTDPDKPAPVATLADSHALTVEFSPRGTVLAVGGIGRGVRLWDTTNPAQPAPITEPEPTIGGPKYSSYPVKIADLQIVTALGFSPDGRTLAVGASADDGVLVSHVEVVDITDPHKPVSTASYPTPTRTLSVAVGDSTDIFSAGDEKNIRQWHPALDPVLPKAGGDWDFTPNSHILLLQDHSNLRSSEKGRKFRLWRTDGALQASPAGTFTEPDLGAVYTVNDRTLLSISDLGGPVRLWDISDPDHPVPGATLNKPPGFVAHTGSPFTSATDVAAEDRLVAVNGADGQIHLWEVTDPHAPTPLSTVPFTTPGRLGLGKQVLISLDHSGRGRQIHVWDITDPRRPVAATPGDLDGNSLLVAAAPNLLGIAMSEANPKAIQLWNLSDLRRLDHGDIPRGVVNNFAISHDRRTLAVAADKTVDLWDITDLHRPVKTRAIAAERLRDLKFSPDDHLLVGGPISFNATDPSSRQLHLWNVTDRRKPADVATITLPAYPDALGFSRDGRAILVGQNDPRNDTLNQRAFLIDPDIDDITKRLCDAAGGALSVDQWRQHFPGTPYNPPCG